MQRCYIDCVLDTSGNVLPDASVYVYLTGTSTPATIYSDDGITSIANPTTTNAVGQIVFWAANSTYDLKVTKTGYADTWYRGVLLEDPSQGSNAGQDSSGALVTPSGATTARTLAAMFGDHANVLNFGADPTAGTASDAAFAAAVATNKPVYIPAGSYKLLDKITFGRGQLVFGDGRTISKIMIGTDFNMSATGVFDGGPGEPGFQIENIGFFFTQADQGVRANCTQYPPAIDVTGNPRFVINNVRIESAWDGILATGNTGGACIGFIEVGALNVGLEFDGALDSVEITSANFWPFGLSSTTNLYPLVYKDDNTRGFKCGRVDGLVAQSIRTFANAMEFTAAASSSAALQVQSMGLDGDHSRLLINGGILFIGQLYETKSSTPTLPSIAITTGRCVIGMLDSRSSLQAPVVSVTGGHMQINGGRVLCNNAAQQVAKVTNGILAVRGVFIEPAQSVAFTNPHIEQVAPGVLQVVNSTWVLEPTTGSGAAIGFASDLAGNTILGCNTGAGWTVTYPPDPQAGIYGPDRAITTFTPTVTFATPGDVTFTPTTQQGNITFLGSAYLVQIRLVGVITHTTAAGQARIDISPFQCHGLTGTAYPVTRRGGINNTAGYTLVEAAFTAGNTYFDLQQSGTAVAPVAITTANIPTGGTLDISLSVVMRMR